MILPDRGNLARRLEVEARVGPVVVAVTFHRLAAQRPLQARDLLAQLVGLGALALAAAAR